MRYLFLSGAALLALTACSVSSVIDNPDGGGGGGNGGEPSSLLPFSDTTADKQSDLRAAEIQTPGNGQNGALFVVSALGEYDHGTKVATLDDTTASLTDNHDGHYEYTRDYTRSFTKDGLAYDVVAGVVGIEADDVPTTGSATYKGHANALLKQSGDNVGSYQLTNGTSAITADFAAKTVDVTMTGFTSQEITAPTLTNKSVSFDTITITGMTIDGTSFSDGVISTSLNGAGVDLGAGTHRAEGAFYGPAGADGAPPEVGGAFLAKNTDHSTTLSGTFLGKKE